MLRGKSSVSLILIALTTFAGWAQNRPDVIQQLLDLPAPPPTLLPPPKAPSLAGFDARTPPPDNAPIGLLEAYWSVGGPHPDKAKMPDAVRQRFLTHAEQHRDKLPFYLEQEWLPDTPDTHARVRAVMDAGLTSYYGQTDDKEVRRHEEGWKAKLQAWLLLHSQFYLDELAQKARDSKDENGEITAEKYLRALAKLDWERAQPLLENYSYSSHLRTATLALTLRYEHAVKTNSNEVAGLRTRLQELVAHPQSPGKARDLACQALMQAPWEGRDDWFLARFADDSLRVIEDGGSGTLYPLNKPVQADPERWIPLLAKLVGHSNPAVHEAAVDCLASFDPDSPRKEALQLLLPWLANPNWSAAEGRKELLQSLAKVSLPSAVPGLLAVVENDEDEELRLLAVEALGAQRDPRAVAPLKRLLTRVDGPTERTTVVNALVACGGLSDDEIARAIEAYATRIAVAGKGDPAETIAEADIDFDSNVPLQVAVGKVLSETEAPREAVATRLLDRIQRLERTQPALAQLLLTLVQRWNLRTVDADIVARLAAGKADVKAVQAALQIRDRLRASVSDELQSIAVRGNAAAGLAAVLLGDENFFYKILNDDAAEPKRAMLAAARLTRTPLPIARVGELLAHKTLQFAAERYLISEDSTDARQLILAKHPGEALILGAMATTAATMYAKAEAQFRAEVLASDEADEIIALLSPLSIVTTTRQLAGTQTISSSRIVPNQTVIRVRKGHAELVWRTDEEREKVRTLTATEWQELQTFLREKNIDALPPRLSPSGSSRMEFEFLRLTKQGGRRVHITDMLWVIGMQDPYSLLLHQFRMLTEGKEFRVRYDIEARVKGLEVVLADENSPVTTLCGEGGKLLALVSRLPETIRVMKGQVEASGGRAVWHEIIAGKLGAEVQPPKTCGASAVSLPDPKERLLNPTQEEMMRLIYVALGTSFGNYSVRPRQGIVRWPWLPQSEVFLVGEYQDVLESSDGNWLLAIKANAAGLLSLVRIEVATRRETPINFAVTGKLQLFAAIPRVNKFVFKQQRSDGGSQGYLVTPTTGAVESIQGNAGPLLRRPQRDFQPTGNPDEVWAAAPNPALRVTEIGRYNLKTFSFTPLRTIPELSFTSDALWVDAAANAIYIVYRGHLLRFLLNL